MKNRKVIPYPNNKDRTFHFVGGGSDKFCCDSIHWVVEHTHGGHKLQRKRHIT